MSKIKIILFIFSFIIMSTVSSYSGKPGFFLEFPETDSSEDKLIAFFDLRERESYIQITNTGNDLNPESDGDRSGDNLVLHVQIFNVDDNCNENNFFDVYTPGDTHVYNMRDIVSNDGSPSGVVLPENAYGIVSVGVIEENGTVFSEGTDSLIGNIRILDNAGYEYRTNITSDTVSVNFIDSLLPQEVTFNFNTEGGVILSDVVGINYTKGEDDDDDGEIVAADILDVRTGWSVDIFNNSEIAQSCRNVVFACVDEDNPLLEELLEEVASGDDDDDFGASVAAFEYGINNSVPHSRGGELLCPGNITSEGFVKMRLETLTHRVEAENINFIGYIGLNNGNGRGTLDSFWFQNGRFCSTQELCQSDG